jgi:hypothetical protein
MTHEIYIRNQVGLRYFGSRRATTAAGSSSGAGSVGSSASPSVTAPTEMSDKYGEHGEKGKVFWKSKCVREGEWFCLRLLWSCIGCILSYNPKILKLKKLHRV